MVSRHYALCCPCRCCRRTNIWAPGLKSIDTTFNGMRFFFLNGMRFRARLAYNVRFITAFLLFANAFQFSNINCMRMLWIFLLIISLLITGHIYLNTLKFYRWSLDCIRQPYLAHMQLHLITGNEVSYQKTSLPMRMLKVTSMSYKALVKRCNISSMLK